MMLTSTQWIQVPSHSGKLALFILNIFLSLRPVSAEQEQPVQVPVIEAQRSMVQQLSGALPLVGDEYLSARSTARERGLVADFLYSSLSADGFEAQRHKYKVSNKLAVLDLFFNPFIGENVYTVIPATVSSKEYVILGAHYDSEPGSPGANDNATGVALVYKVAQQLQALGHRERNFIIVFFDQEEDHHMGSTAFAEKLIKEGACVHSVHTADMVGWDADGDRAVELELPSPELAQQYAQAAGLLDMPLFTTQVNSSDHASFRERGFNAVGIAEEYVNGDSTPHYHKATDTADTVNYEYLSAVTQLVWEVMKSLAVKDQPQNL